MTSDGLQNHDERVDVRLMRGFASGTLPRDLLICGPAGTGKTWSILSVLHQIAADYAKLRILFVRQTRVSLTDSALVTYEQEILPADGMEEIARGARRTHRSSYNYPNGSEIVLGGMDSPTRITSTSWDIIFVNEAIELEEEAWEIIGSRLNRPGRDPQWGFLIGDTNPGDPSHWLKKRCLDGRTALWNTSHEANPALHDGANWTEAGEGYLARLSKLQGTRRKRYLEGIWSAGEGQWFETFSDAHQTKDAEFDPSYPVHLAVDSGVHTGAVWFQVRPGHDGPMVTIFGDYYAFNLPANDAARQIRELGVKLCGGRFDRGTTDPAGKASSPIGPTVIGEYQRAGLQLDFWPSFPGSVVDGLALIESFVAMNPPALTVHPRCQHMIDSFSNYSREKRAKQWIDRPKDPQHPHEELMDSLRGGLLDKFPQGRRPEPIMRRIHPSQVF